MQFFGVGVAYSATSAASAVLSSVSCSALPSAATFASARARQCVIGLKTMGRADGFNNEFICLS